MGDVYNVCTESQLRKEGRKLTLLL